MVSVPDETHSVHHEDAGPPPVFSLVQLGLLYLFGVQDVPLEFAAVDVALAGEYLTYVLAGVADFELKAFDAY
jgi:hypothetical protein